MRCRHVVPKPDFHFCLPICQVFRGGNLGWCSLKAVACPHKSPIWIVKDWDRRAAGCRSAPGRQIANNVRVVPRTFRWCSVFSSTLVLRLVSISSIFWETLAVKTWSGLAPSYCSKLSKQIALPFALNSVSVSFYCCSHLFSACCLFRFVLYSHWLLTGIVCIRVFLYYSTINFWIKISLVLALMIAGSKRTERFSLQNCGWKCVEEITFLPWHWWENRRASGKTWLVWRLFAGLCSPWHWELFFCSTRIKELSLEASSNSVVTSKFGKSC